MKNKLNNAVEDIIVNVIILLAAIFLVVVLGVAFAGR